MPSHTLNPFPAELLAAKKQIREQARSYGLDFFPTIFEMCDYEQMNQIAAYGGFPQRYPHWRFGMEYEDRKSTRLNSSHLGISYAVFCLKKKNKTSHTKTNTPQN